MPPETQTKNPQNNPPPNAIADETAPVALLLIDVINDLEFPGAEKLMRYIPEMTERIARLKARAKDAGIAVIYVNDNYGRWKSDFNKIVAHCTENPVRGQEMAQRLRPDEDDYFVLKPKHSGFFSTSLEVLLEHLQARTLILTGLAGNICVQYTANDAYMRDIKLFVPADCCASNEKTDNDDALQQMRDLLKADISASDTLDLEEIVREAAQNAAPISSDGGPQMPLH